MKYQKALGDPATKSGKTLQDIGLGYYSSFDDFFLRTQIAWNLNSKPISSEYTNHKNSKFLVQAGWVFYKLKMGFKSHF